MTIGEWTTVLTHRHSAYAFLLVGLGLAATFLYAFNYTSFFGAVAQ